MPATSTPEIAADVPVPCCTTPWSSSWMTAAAVAGMHAAVVGVAYSSLLPWHLMVQALDLGDPDRALVAGRRARGVDPQAAGGDRLVGVRHVQRGHALLEAADDHRVVGGDRRADAHRRGHLRDPLGADPGGEAELGEDAVVGDDRGATARLIGPEYSLPKFLTM